MGARLGLAAAISPVTGPLLFLLLLARQEEGAPTGADVRRVAEELRSGAPSRGAAATREILARPASEWVEPLCGAIASFGRTLDLRIARRAEAMRVRDATRERLLEDGEREGRRPSFDRDYVLAVHDAEVDLARAAAEVDLAE